MTRRKSLSMSSEEFMKHVAINNIIITPATKGNPTTFTITCNQCKKQHTVKKRCNIIKGLNENFTPAKFFCSNKCSSLNNITAHSVSCLQCTKEFTKIHAYVIKFPNHFCSSSCAATYNNARRKTGYRRSKLEVYVEENLTKLYPDINFETNNRSATNYELDFYFPELNLAIEINGPCHYKQIYSEKQFQRIQKADKEKAQQCKNKGIQLFIIDVSKDSSPKKFLTQRFSEIENIMLSFAYPEGYAPS